MSLVIDLLLVVRLVNCLVIGLKTRKSCAFRSVWSFYWSGQSIVSQIVSSVYCLSVLVSSGVFIL